MRRAEKRSVLGCLVGSFLAVLWIPAVALTPVEVQKLLAQDGAAEDQFGGSIALDGDTAVIGAQFESDDGLVFNGAAYVFTQSGGVWTQQAKLLASDKMNRDHFGFSVAVAGDTAVIGAPTYVGDRGAGAAFVFTRSGDVWTEQAKLTRSDAIEGASSCFGCSVAIDGDIAIIGDRYDGPIQEGAAYVFTRSGGVWTEQAKLKPRGQASGAYFGNSVAVAGDTAVIGATYFFGTQRGAAYVFTRSAGVWTEEAILTASDGDQVSNDAFGHSVAIDDGTAVISAIKNDEGGEYAGAAYVFTRSGGVWTEQAKLLAGDEAVSTFGRFVSVDGDIVVCTAYYNQDFYAAYVFARSGGVWTEPVRFMNSDQSRYDFFGSGVGVDGTTIIVGSRGNNQAGERSGAAYVFSLSTEVEINIKPGSDRNPINLKSKGNIPVAILGSETFDATQVNWETVRFGPAGATERHQRIHIKDANYDGYIDVVLHFKTRDTGILCGDTEATLMGETFSGDEFAGSDVIKIVKCPKNKKNKKKRR